MCISYTETYMNLYHGTTDINAAQIVASQCFIPSKSGWCGAGVYFYDIKSKAWWSARRTCQNVRKNGITNVKEEVVEADIIDLDKKYILDLRAPRSLQEFAMFVDAFLEENDFEVTDTEDEFEANNIKRAMLISFFCKKRNIKLVVGYFKQKAQSQIDQMKSFADDWLLVIGIENIFCVKDNTILKNIRRR